MTFAAACVQEVYDLDAPMDATAKKLIDAAGAGQSVMSPGWLTELGRLWGGTSVRQRLTGKRLLTQRMPVLRGKTRQAYTHS